MQNLDIISVNLWQILISLCNLLLLFLILKFFLFKPVQKVFDTRKTHIDTLYGDAQSAKEQAEKEEASYRERLETADRDAQEILKNARERADRLSNEIVTDANAKANSMMRQAEGEIAQEKKKAFDEIKGEISAMSLDIAGKVIGREVKEEDHAQFIDDFLKDLGD